MDFVTVGYKDDAGKWVYIKMKEKDVLPTVKDLINTNTVNTISIRKEGK